MGLIDRFRIWRLRPGILCAAKLAEQAAWTHRSTSMLGPENNLMKFSVELHMRLLAAEEGKPDGFYLDPVTHMPKGWEIVESER